MNDIYNKFYSYVEHSPNKGCLINYYVYNVGKHKLKNLKLVLLEAERFITEFCVGKSKVYSDYLRSLFKVAVFDYAQNNNITIDKSFLRRAKTQKRSIFFLLLVIFSGFLTCGIMVAADSDTRYNVNYFYVNNISDSEFIDIKYATPKDRDKLSEYKGNYMPTVIPRGYTVSEVKNTGSIFNITYIGLTGDKEKIVFTQHNHGPMFGMDDKCTSTVLISGDKQAFVSQSQSGNTITWFENDNMLKIGTDSDLDLSAFANSVCYIN